MQQAITISGSVNAAMIVLAREARALAQGELAGRINMSATNLSKIERGDIGVNPWLMQSIAAVTEYPTHFFQQAGGIRPHALSYRKREVVAQKLIAPINARANISCRHVQFLTKALQVPAMNLPVVDVSNKSPATAAAALRKHWRLSPGPIANLVRVIERAEIPVSCFDFGTGRVDSRSLLTEEAHAVICLNNAMTGDRARFSLAYEIGQLVMHAFTDVHESRDIGKEASRFAAELLMPEEDIRPDFQDGINLALLGRLKRKWKVSMIALLYRADDLGYLTPNQKRYLLQQFNTAQIRRREPVELDIAFEQPALVKQWIASYKARTGLGMAEMAAVLCLHTDEFLRMYA